MAMTKIDRDKRPMAMTKASKVSQGRTATKLTALATRTTPPNSKVRFDDVAPGPSNEASLNSTTVLRLA